MAAPQVGDSRRIRRFGLFEFDPRTLELKRNGTPVRLQEQPAAILALLLEQPGEVVTRERFRQTLWRDRTYGDFEAGLNTAVNKLRSTLGDSAERSIYVETVPKTGYRFSAPVHQEEEPKVVSIDRQSTAAPGESPARETAVPPISRRIRWIAAGVAGLLAAGGGLWVARTREPPIASWIMNSHAITSFPGSPERPAFSPDGKTIAFEWAGPEGRNRDIYVLRIGADSPFRLTSHAAEEFYPVWSPEGGEVAFLRAEGDQALAIVRRIVPGEQERVVARVARGAGDRPRLAWSRDGNLLLTSERPQPAQAAGLVAVDAASGSKRKLTTPPSGDMLGDDEAIFSPDGKWIAFRRTIRSGIADVFLIAAAGGSERRLTSDDAAVLGMCWTPSGRSLILSSRRRSSVGGQLWELPISGGQPTPLTPSAIAASAPAISADGKQLVFVQSLTNTNIYEIDLRSKAPPQRLLASINSNGEPQYSPDGSRIAFRSNRSGSPEFWLSPRGGGDPVRITRIEGKAAGSQRWSPDGKHLVFNAITKANDNLFVVNADGTGFRRLTPEDSQAANPVYSPDGKYLYFGSNAPGTPEIYRAPAAFSEPPVQLTKGSANIPAISPDGRTLYYDRRQPPGILALPLDGPLPAEGRLLAVPAVPHKWAVTRSGIYFLDRDESMPEPLRIRFLAHGGGKVRDIAPVPRQSPYIDGTFDVSPDERFALFGLVDRAGNTLTLARQPDD